MNATFYCKRKFKGLLCNFSINFDALLCRYGMVIIKKNEKEYFKKMYPHSS